jgi:hypothetical protein
MKKSKNKKADLITLDPEYKKFIVMNEYLQVWVGVKDGGRTLIFSDDFNDAKPLFFNSQFRTLSRISRIVKIEQIYI